MFRKTVLLGVLALTAATNAFAEEGTLRADHPRRYEVQAGDTLWGISQRFLRDPWLWPEIWHENSSIENPHLIYPGDVVSLTTVGGEPRLTVERGGGTVKLSPKVRVEDLDDPITSIPVAALQPFLDDTGFVSAQAYADAPYIVASAEERVMASTGDPIYVRGIDAQDTRQFEIMRRRGPFIDPQSGNVLGIEATPVGSARMRRRGDPATLSVTSSNREILPGDRLFPVDNEEIATRLFPRPPEQPIEGVIMDVMDGVSQIGQYDVVAINRGRADGLEVGNVLEIYRRGRVVEDHFAQEYADATGGEMVRLPDERGGVLVVFQSFEQMAFGLVMEASRALAVDDLVRSP